MSVTFIQVFQLHQFLKTRSNVTQNIENDLCLENDSRCRTIISLLKQNGGLKNYLSNQFKQNDIALISIIFNHCCKIYSSQFDDILIQIDKNTIGKCQYQVWKQQDLVPLIFKFLNLNEINACSKVSCSWLYHAFNQSCMPLRYYIRRKYPKLQRVVGIRSRQRMSAVKSLRIDWVADWNNYSWIFSLKRVICLCIDDVGSDKTTICRINSSPIGTQLEALHISHFSTNGNECLSLPKLRHLQLRDSHVSVCPILELPSCETLILKKVHLDDKWCEIMSQNNYLQNVKKILLEGVRFNCRSESIKKLSLSLTNVEYLHLGDFINKGMMLLWKYLKNTIHRKKTNVFIQQCRFDISDFNLVHFIQSNQLQIDHFYSLEFDSSYFTPSEYKTVKKLIIYHSKWLRSIHLLFFQSQSWDDFCNLLITNNGNNISVFPNLSSISVGGLIEHHIPMQASSIFKYLVFAQNQQQFQLCGVVLNCSNMKYFVKQDIKNIFQIIRDLINGGIPLHISITINRYASNGTDAKNKYYRLRKELFIPIFGKLDGTAIHVDQHWYYEPVSCPILSFTRHQYKHRDSDKINYYMNFLASTAKAKREIIGGRHKSGDEWEVMVERCCH